MLEAFAFLTYLRPMNRKTVDAPGTLLDFLVGTCGFATNTRARKSIKAGEISVDGVPLRIPSAALAPGQKVAWGKPSSKDFAVPPIRGAAPTRSARAPQAAEPPFEIIHEDEHLIAYIKPAGWVFASPRPQVKSAYSRMREWLAVARPECTDLHFVNRIEMESSGISIIAKDRRWRAHLQGHWASFPKRIYLVLEGSVPVDGEITVLEQGEHGRNIRAFPYRAMRANDRYTMLRTEADPDDVPALLGGLRRLNCVLLGKGKEAPDPMGRAGIHLFEVALTGPEGQEILLKSRVPREFLTLMRGGKLKAHTAPKASPAAHATRPEKASGKRAASPGGASRAPRVRGE
jgi:23S rRNA-/tRNA-specific pseudouridylate synthase